MKKQKPRPVWIVEMLNAKEWSAFSDYASSKYSGVKMLKSWKIAAPKRKFRLRKYLPQED